MLILIQQLENTIESLSVTGNAQPTGMPQAETVAQLCRHIRSEVPLLFRQYADTTVARDHFIRYRRQLVRLLETTSRHSPEDNLNSLTTPIRRLLEYHEQMFNDLIPANETLCSHYTRELEAHTNQVLPALIPQLEAKGIPLPYLAELQQAADSLFAADKLPPLVYHHRRYVPAWLEALTRLAQDPRTKDWPLRFNRMLVNYNFNYLGFINRWCEAKVAEVDQALANGQAPLLLLHWQQQLSHAHPLAGMGYDPGSPSLFRHMERFIDGQHRRVELLLNQQQHRRNWQAKTTLPADEMALDLHYRYKHHIYQYPNKREAAEAYARTHRSKTDIEVSSHTVEKFDKEALREAAIRYRRKLLAQLKSLDSDFGLK